MYFCLCLTTNTYRNRWLVLDFHHCKGHGRCFTLGQTSYRGNTAGQVPMFLLMRLTFVDDERTTELNQYWWLHTNNGSFRFEPPDDRDRRSPPLLSPMELKKKRCLVAICSAEGVGMERAGSRFSLITEPVKSFGAPPAAASLSYVSKFCHRGRRTTQNNPHFVTRWFMITVLPWYPGAFWCTKLVFSPFSFLPVFVARRKNWHH